MIFYCDVSDNSLDYKHMVKVKFRADRIFWYNNGGIITRVSRGNYMYICIFTYCCVNNFHK